MGTAAAGQGMSLAAVAAYVKRIGADVPDPILKAARPQDFADMRWL